jgi:23S rRNA pseudouridine955/2504/2580 synthase
MASLLNRVKSAIFKNTATEAAPLISASASRQWRTVKMTVDSDWDNVRLDRLLTKKFDISASLAQKLIRTNKIWIERSSSETLKKVTARSALRVETGDSINLAEVFLPERKPRPAATATDAELLKSWTLFEDSELLVLNKPAGWAMHQGPGIRDSIDALLQRVNPEFRLIHRLDKDTSGVLLVGKTRTSTEAIQSLFSHPFSSELKKTYLAVVAGTPKEREGRLQTLIYGAKRAFGSPFEPQMTSIQSKRADLLDEGRVAITDYRMLSARMAKIRGVRVKLSLMEFTPQTGRTHQIRVHAAEQLGCPIVGDRKYGLTTIYNLSRINGVGRALHLHCKSIKLPTHQYEASLPRHFAQTLTTFPLYIKPPRPGKK